MSARRSPPATDAAFSLKSPAGASAAQSAAPVLGPSALGSLEALLALQDIGSPTERRKRAVKRAGGLLDILDDLKLGLIDGGISADVLTRLARAMREERPKVDNESDLSALLDQIEIRARVELAKAEVAAEA